jgi:hypothetical protein
MPLILEKSLAMTGAAVGSVLFVEPAPRARGDRPPGGAASESPPSADPRDACRGGIAWPSKGPWSSGS